MEGVPILLAGLSMYASGRMNRRNPTRWLPLLLLPFVLFKPFNYAYFPFLIPLVLTGVLMLVISRAGQKPIYRGGALAVPAGIFLFYLLGQPLILQ